MDGGPRQRVEKVGFLVFAAVAALVVGGPLVWMALRSFRTRPGTTNMVLIWHSNSEADKAITVGALQSAGIITHVVQSGGYYSQEFGRLGSMGSQYEVWVPERDGRRAREVLGL
jgi:ABC-type glycerol-3-phosphate transport system permease component